MSRMTRLTLTLIATLIATLAIAPLPVAAAPTPEFPLTLYGNESVAASTKSESREQREYLPGVGFIGVRLGQQPEEQVRAAPRNDPPSAHAPGSRSRDEFDAQ